MGTGMWAQSKSNLIPPWSMESIFVISSVQIWGGRNRIRVSRVQAFEADGSDVAGLRRPRSKGVHANKMPINGDRMPNGSPTIVEVKSLRAIAASGR